MRGSLPKKRTFSLGAALVAIGDAALRENPIVDEARVEMARLAKELEMGAVALVRAGSDALCVARAGPRPPRVDPPEVGQRIPIMAPLVSVFVAWAPEEDRRTVGARLREQFNINPSEDCSTCHR